MAAAKKKKKKFSVVFNESVLRAILLSTSSPFASESQALQEQSGYVLHLP